MTRALVDILDGAGWIILLVVAGLAGFLFRRTALRRRGATMNCGLRLGIAAAPRAWHLGMVRFTAEDLEWYRLLSLAFQPKWTFVRRSIEITGRRDPQGTEAIGLPHTSVIVVCNVITRQGDTFDVELAMSEAALNGFLAWIESSAPGAHTHPDTRVT
ncbi:MAG: hypothetical protein QOJ62_1817 [Actinomycetota bacterium]|jgi:hypothetical protein|nr:hypothetical protein [Actinomycetota bacterium]